MIKTIVAILAAILLLAAGAYLALELGPAMLTSGRPELILLAWLLPFCWLVGGLFGYIAWADSSWPPPEPLTFTQGVKPENQIDVGALITGT